jgi:catechol 2,3-dioxygenase-like lactoylglutathione lyase family enzyme
MGGAADPDGEGRSRIVREAGSVAGNPAVPDMRLELVPIPVSDVDRAKAFYEQAGFGNLHDTQVTDAMRVVQLTPPGSGCAIVFGTGMGPITDMAPGSVKGIHLVVADMAASRAALAARGVGVSDVQDMGGVLYSSFSDPDGNLWTLQQWPAGYQP